uniref:PDZ domain-containing protein n=1 Tax=Oryza brachyantha TaxID=4533 RepID=J3M476_ORYBR
MPPKWSKARAVTAAGASSAAPRVTRLRSRVLGLETAPAGGDPGPLRKTRKRVPPEEKEEEGGSAKAAVDGGSPKIPAPADTVIPCTCRREPKDLRTARDVASTPDKAMVKKAALSVVGILATKPDGKWTALCSGIVVSWNETTRLGTIVTSSHVVCLCGELIDPIPKLLVHLPNKTIVEGRLLFFNAHYRILLLEVLSDSPLHPANFGSNPEFGQEGFALARDDESSLFARRGTVLWQEPPSYLNDMYRLCLSCEVAQCGTGRSVIDQHGDVIGMAFCYQPNILPISILQTCIGMWTKFSRIARPVLDMELRAFELLDVSHQEEHNIRDGFIVTLVYDDSIPASLDMSQGDIIVSYNGQYDFTLHKFEDFLLSLGWDLLANADSSWKVGLELEVYDPVTRTTRSITFT